MTKLFPYQKTSVRRILKLKGRALLALEMGLGKTLVALTYLQKRPKQRPVLIVTPAAAKWVWKSEIRKHTKLSGRILNGTKARRFRPRDVTLINYDILPYWADILRRIRFQALILDECHYIKSYKAKRTKAVLSLGRQIPHIIALSGTPITNRPKEMFTTLKLLHPQRFHAFQPYAHRYCGRKMTPWGWDDRGASHLDELHRILTETCMIRRTKSEVLTELPDKTRIVVPLSIENEKEYRQAETKFKDWLTSKGKNKKFKSAEKLVQLGCLKRLAAELKMKAVFEWIDTMLEDTNEKVVVFAYHKKIVKMLHDRYKKTSVVVDGSTTGKQKEKAVRRFQKDGKVRLLIGNIIAAGTAITLTAASTAVFVELDWVPGNHIQAEDRIHRIGQTKKTFIYYLIAKGTLEEKLCKVVQKKFRTVTSILDGTERHDLDIFDSLMKWYERGMV